MLPQPISLACSMIFSATVSGLPTIAKVPFSTSSQVSQPLMNDFPSPSALMMRSAERVDV